MEQQDIDPRVGWVKHSKMPKDIKDLKSGMQIEQPHSVVLWFSVFEGNVLQTSEEASIIADLVLGEN